MGRWGQNNILSDSFLKNPIIFEFVSLFGSKHFLKIESNCAAENNP